MMVLLFKLDNARYALDVNHIVEIMPKVAIKPLPRVPSHIPGLINYRGKVVPVVDLVMLVNHRPASNSLSTRIVLVRLSEEGERERFVGLIVERATETTKIDPLEILDTGVNSGVDSFVDKIVLDHDEMVGIVNLGRLVPVELHSMIESGHGLHVDHELNSDVN